MSAPTIAAGVVGNAPGSASLSPRSANAAPACFHQLPCQALHFHITAAERRACEAEHNALMARWS